MQELSIVQLEVRLEMTAETADNCGFTGWGVPNPPDGTVVM
ncbi:MAG TPA: hypothetical protein VFS25_05155 [Chitinophaga sp.]|jgi:hypothetical protein|nr:hypothetical protein [Chitinophaga sp.]HEU4552196.1 hypothetical protein [Chitinophaga sp.]